MHIYQTHDPDAAARPVHARRCRSAGACTYRQIAAILTQREGKSISTTRVEQICRTAERKLARALLDDAVLGEWLTAGGRL